MKRMVMIMMMILGLFINALSYAKPPLEQAFNAYALAQKATIRSDRLAYFGAAEIAFTYALENHQSVDLYYNLGTSAVQAEHLGVAILAYRRALWLDPDHKRVRQNLEQARLLLPTWLPKPQQSTILSNFFFWQHSFNAMEQHYLAAFCFFLASLLLAISIRFKINILKNIAFFPLLLWLAIMLTKMQIVWQAPLQEGVIVQETIAHAADSINSPQRLSKALPAGTEVVVLEQRAPWLRIRLVNDQDVWVKASTIGLIN